MHLSKIIDLGYDLVPTVAATVVVVIAVVRDARLRRRRLDRGS
jgi:hypothetical protein